MNTETSYSYRVRTTVRMTPTYDTPQITARYLHSKEHVGVGHLFRRELFNTESCNDRTLFVTGTELIDLRKLENLPGGPCEKRHRVW